MSEFMIPLLTGYIIGAVVTRILTLRQLKKAIPGMVEDLVNKLEREGLLR